VQAQTFGQFLIKEKRAQLYAHRAAFAKIFEPYFGPKLNVQNVGLIWELLLQYHLVAELLEAEDVLDAHQSARLRDTLLHALTQGVDDPDAAVSRFLNVLGEVRETAKPTRVRYRFVSLLFLRDILGRPELRPRDQEVPFEDLFHPPFSGLLDDLERLLLLLTNVAARLACCMLLSQHAPGWFPLSDLCTDTERAQPGTIVISDGELIQWRWWPIEYPRRVRAIAFADGTWLLRPRSVISRFRSRTQPSGRLLNIADPALKAVVLDRMMAASENWRKASMWFAALDRGNVDLLVGEDPLPDTRFPLGDAEFQQRWEQLRPMLEIGDILWSRDTADRVSTVIARFDRGSWSHVAYCVGNGSFLEVDWPRSYLGDAEHYANSRFRLALLRPQPQPFVPRAHVEAARIMEGQIARSTAGRGYNYLGACFAGLSSFVCASPKRAATPNAIVRSGQMIPLVVA
jgi:hypothetical protein